MASRIASPPSRKRRMAVRAPRSTSPSSSRPFANSSRQPHLTDRCRGVLAVVEHLLIALETVLPLVAPVRLDQPQERVGRDLEAVAGGAQSLGQRRGRRAGEAGPDVRLPAVEQRYPVA